MRPLGVKRRVSITQFHQQSASLAAIMVLRLNAGTFPESDPLALGMLGMHGTVFANYAVNDADLLLAMGVRFDDRVTGAACSPDSLPTLVPAI